MLRQFRASLSCNRTLCMLTEREREREGERAMEEKWSEGREREEKQQQSSLNPISADLLRESIVGSNMPKEEKRSSEERKGAEGNMQAHGPADVLAFARSVHQVDSSLE